MNTIEKVFDSKCFNWDEMGSINEVLLKGNRDYFNELLQARGYLFLREIYDALGFEVTRESCELGWVKGQNLVDGKETIGIVEFHFMPMTDNPSNYKLIFTCYPILDYLPVENVAAAK